MNLLVKAAKDKYVTSLKTTTDVLEAVKMTFEKHYEPAIKGFEYHTWRKERYYNEQVDNFLKAYLPILDALYKSWAKQKGPRNIVVKPRCIIDRLMSITVRFNFRISQRKSSEWKFWNDVFSSKLICKHITSVCKNIFFQKC